MINANSLTNNSDNFDICAEVNSVLTFIHIRTYVEVYHFVDVCVQLLIMTMFVHVYAHVHFMFMCMCSLTCLFMFLFLCMYVRMCIVNVYV